MKSVLKELIEGTPTIVKMFFGALAGLIVVWVLFMVFG